MKNKIEKTIFKIILLVVHLVATMNLYSQKPANGTYTYKIAFDEWGGKSMGCTCVVKIIGDSITIINNGSLSGYKGEIIDQGIIIQHIKTGKWIIAHAPKDKNAKDVGGCGDGPHVIDFKHKVFWLC